MVKVYSKALNQEIEVGRFIGKIENNKGPVVVFTGGIHGNEPSGVFALKRVFDQIEKEQIPLSGSIYALTGNLASLEKGQRYETSDLNRLWTEDQLKAIDNKSINIDNQDIKEQIELYNIILEILNTHKNSTFYFIDLHTTSSPSTPFITLNDTLLNRKFSLMFPVPSVLGIEEHIEGPLLSYMNEMGHVALGFEAGQHDDIISIDNHEAFIWLALKNIACIENTDAIDFDQVYRKLAGSAVNTQKKVYEIRYRYAVNNQEGFTMKPGFLNFQKIDKNQVLAQNQAGEIRALENGRIFMPLYQSQGNDGFFLIRKISKFWLNLSIFLRKIRLENLLVLLPGIKKNGKDNNMLLVDTRVAKFKSKAIFHLLGYRIKKKSGGTLSVKRREFNL